MAPNPLIKYKKRSKGSNGPAKQVLHMPELLECILPHLGPQDISNLCLLAKGLVPLIFNVRYREMFWGPYQKADRSTYYGALKCDSVRILRFTIISRLHVNERGIPPLEYFEPDLLKNVVEKCPNVQQIHCGVEGGPAFMQRQFTRNNDTGERSAALRLSYQVDPNKAFEGEFLDDIDCPGWVKNITLDLSFVPDDISGDYSVTRCLQWMSREYDWDPRIAKLRIDFAISLPTLQSILEKNTCPVKEVEVWSFSPCTFDQFAAFAKKVGGKLHILNLKQNDEAVWVPPRISLMDLPKFVRILREDFPLLRELEISINGLDNDRQPILDEDIPISDLTIPNGQHALQKVTIFVEDAFDDAPVTVPVYALAKNLACLGDSTTSFCIGSRVRLVHNILHDPTILDDYFAAGMDGEIELYEAMGPPRLMNTLVRYVKGLPPLQRAKLNATKMSELDIPEHERAKLRDLTFEPDGTPIPLLTEQARRTLDDSAAAYTKMKDELDEDLELTAEGVEKVEEWKTLLTVRNVPFEPPYWPFDDILHARKQLEEKCEELEKEKAVLAALKKEEDEAAEEMKLHRDALTRVSSQCLALRNKLRGLRTKLVVLKREQEAEELVEVSEDNL